MAQACHERVTTASELPGVSAGVPYAAAKIRNRDTVIVSLPTVCHPLRVACASSLSNRLVRATSCGGRYVRLGLRGRRAWLRRLVIGLGLAGSLGLLSLLILLVHSWVAHGSPTTTIQTRTVSDVSKASKAVTAATPLALIRPASGAA